MISIHISWTKEALYEIKRRLRPNEYVKLVYDTEGCGCSTDGVPLLYRVASIEKHDGIADENVPLLYDKRDAVFFEDHLQIDFHTQKNTFVLKSDNQIYAPRLVLNKG